MSSLAPLFCATLIIHCTSMATEGIMLAGTPPPSSVILPIHAVVCLNHEDLLALTVRRTWHSHWTISVGTTVRRANHIGCKGKLNLVVARSYLARGTRLLMGCYRSRGRFLS